VKRILGILSCLSLLASSVVFADSPQPAGPVQAQAIGRIVIDADGNGQLLCYFTVFGGLQNLFTGARGEATARITARSTKFKIDTTVNGPAIHFRTIPAEGTAILVNFYYDAAPDQNFSQPQTFSNGQFMGTWRWHSSLGTLSPAGLTPSIGAMELVSSNTIFFDGSPFNMKKEGEAGSVFFNIQAPPTITTNLSIPFSAAFIGSK
jgi:hypothetical protein